MSLLCFLWLIPIFTQKPLHDSFGIFVAARSRMAELNHAILIDDEVAGPGVAKIIRPDVGLVVDDNRILDAFFRHSFLDFWDFLFVIEPRRVHTNDDQSIL